MRENTKIKKSRTTSIDNNAREDEVRRSPMENGIYYMETEVKKQRRRIVTYEGRYNYSTAQAAIAGRSVAAHH